MLGGSIKFWRGSIKFWSGSINFQRGPKTCVDPKFAWFKINIVRNFNTGENV